MRLLLPLILANVCLAADPTIPGYEGDTQKALERCVQNYRALETYQDKIEIKMEMETEEDDDARPANQSEARFAFARPNRFVYESDHFKLYCDGKIFWRYNEGLNQYIESPLPKEWGFEQGEAESLKAQGLRHPIAEFLLTDKPVLHLIKDIKKFTQFEGQKRADASGYSIGGEIELAYMNSEPLPFTIWIHETSGLVEEERYDMTAYYQSMMENRLVDEDEDAPPKIKKAVMVTRLTEIKTNEPIAEDRFVFKPGPDDKKVDEFDYGDWQERAEKQQELVGEPAPELKGKDLKDAPIAVSDFKGKVVLLDFWATWCGPCVQALPHIQKLAESYANEKDVVIVGVNRDRAGSGPALTRFLEKKKVTFPQILEVDDEHIEAYRVTGIPCVVLIDKNGILQFIETGFNRGKDEELKNSIGKLLKGEKLFDAEQLTKEREERKLAKAKDGDAEAGETPASQPAEQEPLAEVAPDALVREKYVGARITGVSGWQSKEIDIDGNNMSDLVMPSYDGRLYILKAGQDELEEIRLKKLTGGQLSDFTPVSRAKETTWFVGCSKSMGSRSRLIASFHDPSGEQIWKWEAPIGATHQGEIKVASGDLDGDGIVEFVVAFNTYTLKKIGSESRHSRYRQENPQAYLAILSDKGELLSIRKIGNSIQCLRVVSSMQMGGSGRILVFDNNGRNLRYGFKRPIATQPAS